MQLEGGEDKETGNKGCNSTHHSPPTLTMTTGRQPPRPSNDFSMQRSAPQLKLQRRTLSCSGKLPPTIISSSPPVKPFVFKVWSQIAFVGWHAAAQ